jgi:predicted ATPase
MLKNHLRAVSQGITVNNLGVSYRQIEALRDITLQIHPGKLTGVIGPNGAGKSNFISFFQLMQQMLEGNLQLYVSKQGGPDALLQFGRKTTEEIKAEIYFGENGYKFT